MSKRDKPVKKRKRKPRTNWKREWEGVCAELSTVIRLDSHLKRAHDSAIEEGQDTLRYRLICDWACQRIEKLETQAQTQQREKRILLDTLFEVQAENIMQGEDILRQRDELIKLRGVPGERVSCQR